MQILLLQKRQFKISADVISSNTNFVVSTCTFISLIFNVLIKHDHIREDKRGLLKLQTSSFHHHHHQSSAMFYKPHLFPAIYKISVNICKDIIKLNIYINNNNKTFNFYLFQHFTAFVLPSLSGGQIQSVGMLGLGPLRHVPPPWHGLALQGAVFR
jgi:hypothetical protein